MSVYAWGTGNVNGELGTGERETKLDPALIEGFRGSKIVQIAASEHTVLCITDQGDLYSFGRNREGQLGIGTDDKFCAQPQRIKSLAAERIKSVAVGWNHCLAITTQGELFHWGRLHEAVEEEDSKDFDMAIEMPGMREVTDYKKRLLDRSFVEYYSNGASTDGQAPKGPGAANEALDTYGESNLNFGSFRAHIERSPKLVEGLGHSKVVSAAAGYGFTLIVTEKGRLFAMGFNDKLQLGLGHRFSQHHPQLVRAVESEFIIQVACGQQHSLALTLNGDVFSWGLGVFGQLGHNVCSDENIPKKIEFKHPTNEAETIRIVQIACGSHHSLALDSVGRVWSWGSSEYAQQFQSDAKYYDDWGTAERQGGKKQNYYYSIPRLIQNGFDGKQVVKICCGALHNVAIVQDGDVYTWGWGANGALGHGNKRFQLFPVVINKLKGEKIVTITAGAKSTFAVTASDESSFAFEFKHFVDNPLYSDLTFVVQNRRIHAHKAIVFYRCQHLFQMYLMNARFLYREDSTMVIESIEPMVFLSLLRYLYTDHLRVPPHLVRKLEAVARKFRLPRLAVLCKQVFAATEDKESGVLATPQSTFSAELREAINDRRFADINFELDEQTSVHAHKVLLCARSEYFSTIFEAAFKERGQSTITLKEIKATAFVDLLNYIYTNDIEANGDNFVELILASDRFLAHDMKLRIEKDLEDAMELENVVDLLLLSERASTSRLKKACLDLVVSRIDQPPTKAVLKDLRTVSTSLMREIDYICTKRNLFKPGEVMRMT